jgi:hypothetical protein
MVACFSLGEELSYGQTVYRCGRLLGPLEEARAFEMTPSWFDGEFEGIRSGWKVCGIFDSNYQNFADSVGGLEVFNESRS